MRCVPLVVAGLVALSGCAAGCVSSGPAAVSGSGAVFAAQAEEWMAAYDEAFDRFDDGQVIFLAPDIVQDTGMSNEGFMGDGRIGALGVHSVVYNTEYERGPMYLDATGLVRTDSWVWPRGDAGRGLSPGQTYALLAWLEVGEDGIERYQHLVYGLDGYASIAQRESQVVAEQVAADYVDVRNDTDTGRVAALYAQDATLSDSVLGVQVSGRDAIQALRACQVVCVSDVGHMGLEVGVDAVGVDEGELAEGGFPALGDGAFDESVGGFAGLALGSVGFFGSLACSFVLDGHDGQPDQLDGGGVVGEVAAVLDDLA